MDETIVKQKNPDAKCSKCLYFKSVEDTLGNISFCEKQEVKSLHLNILQQLWDKHKEYYNAGIISDSLYTAYKNGIKKDITFIEDYGSPIDSLEWGRDCFVASSEEA